MTLGVGIVGAGVAAQAIHLPTLACLPDLYRVVAVTDVDTELAQSVAARAGARAVASVAELLADAEVDVVAICSPPRTHAAVTMAACAAGKAGVLCEKPMATTAEDAAAMTAAAGAAGIPLVVGAMHCYDPAWLAVSAAWDDFPGQVRTIRSSIVLPFNQRFEDWAAELERPPAAAAAARDEADTLRQRLLGLAIHDLPLVRRFLPRWRDLAVVHAALLAPIGYLVLLASGDCLVELTGLMHDHWQPDWELEAVSPHARLHVTFPPSYVHAGSATARLVNGPRGTVYGPYGEDGYLAEWRHLAACARGETRPAAASPGAVEDLEFALTVADAAAGFLGEPR